MNNVGGNNYSFQCQQPPGRSLDIWITATDSNGGSTTTTPVTVTINPTCAHRQHDRAGGRQHLRRPGGPF